MNFLKTSAVIIFAVIFFVACGGAENTNSGAKPANTNPTVSAPAGNANQPAGEMKPTAAAFDAKTFYGEKCALCHAEDGKGNAQMKLKDMPDFTNAAWQQKESDAEFAKMIKEGKKPMPGFGDKLTDDQVKALVTLVRAFAKK